jgi:hypothetical protein
VYAELLGLQVKHRRPTLEGTSYTEDDEWGQPGSARKRPRVSASSRGRPASSHVDVEPVVETWDDDLEWAEVASADTDLDLKDFMERLEQEGSFDSASDVGVEVCVFGHSPRSSRFAKHGFQQFLSNA